MSQVIAAVCVVAGIALLIVFRHKTSLTGCGDPHIMEAVCLDEVPPVEEEEEHAPSTIFGDLPEEEVREIFGDTLQEKAGGREAEVPGDWF